jgi:cytosine/adenosine deaminase-related metal-dependent hydrolase
VIEGRDRLVLPGLVNAHTHSSSNLLKGTADRLSHPAFMWLKQADTANRTPREIYVSAMLGCIEMLRSGTTACIDHVPDQLTGLENVEPIAQAYVDSGMRACLAFRFFDGEYSDIYPPEGTPADLLEEVRRVSLLRPWAAADLSALCEEAIGRWHGTADRLSVFPAPSAAQRCTDTLLTACGELAERYDVGIHTHLLETRVQMEGARRQYGCTMVQHLDRLGVLTRRLSCAHTVWIDEEDIGRMADRGAVVVHNPESNLKIGSGIAPIPAMLRRGVTVALGTDGASTNDNQTLQNAMYLAAILHRPSEPRRNQWLSARDVLRMATQGGAAAMLLEGAIGSIEAGKRADLVLYDLTAPWWAPLNDPVQQLVYVDNGGSVDIVLIDGRVVLGGGRITAFDADAIVAEARPMLKAIRARNGDLHRVARRMAEIVP